MRLFASKNNNQLKTSSGSVRVEESDSKKQTRISGAIVMLLLVCTGLICVAGLQYFREAKYPPLQVMQKEAPRFVIKGPASHLRLGNVPERKIFIGFKYVDRMYMDVSELCQQPGFRTHADNKGLIEVQGQDGTELIFETSDVTLPSKLADSIWWVVSSDAQLEERVFDMPYQWLSYAHSPVNGACLFLGEKVGDRIPREFHTHESEPVIGLMGFGAPLDLRLLAHEGLIEVSKDNRVEKLREFPWLLDWLHKFSSEGSEQCDSSDGFMPTSRVLPIKAKILPHGQQDTHWLAATGCDAFDRWSLVMANEDGTTSFITVSMPPHTDDYWPSKAWTVDIDNDGVPEFLIKAQYYEGDRYVLLRLDKNLKGGYSLIEIAGTSYEGL
jgi:hypothetical protein